MVAEFEDYNDACAHEKECTGAVAAASTAPSPAPLEIMAKYKASQRIIQLKKEEAAMKNATKEVCSSPRRANWMAKGPNSPRDDNYSVFKCAGKNAREEAMAPADETSSRSTAGAAGFPSMDGSSNATSTVSLPRLARLQQMNNNSRSFAGEVKTGDGAPASSAGSSDGEKSSSMLTTTIGSPTSSSSILTSSTGRKPPLLPSLLEPLPSRRDAIARDEHGESNKWLWF